METMRCPRCNGVGKNQEDFCDCATSGDLERMAKRESRKTASGFTRLLPNSREYQRIRRMLEPNYSLGSSDSSDVE